MGRERIDQSDYSIFIGDWETEGKILSTDGNPEMEIRGTDTYEVILDGFFILHKADVMMGTEKSQTFELMWLEGSGEEVTLQYYNNAGESGVMQGALVNDIWKIDGKDLRFEGHFNNDHTQLKGIWQRLTADQRWGNFIEIRLSRK